MIFLYVFKIWLDFVPMQQKLSKREGGTIDRSQDIARLQEFYSKFRDKHNVDKLMADEMKLRESGVFRGNLGEYALIP